MARRQERKLDSETSSVEEPRDTERERDLAKGPTEVTTDHPLLI